MAYNNRATRQHIYLALLLTTATAGTWCSKNMRSTYSENLAAHRQLFKVAPVVKKSVKTTHKKKYACIKPIYAITDQLDYLLARRKAVREQAAHIQGYTIQVYAGGSRKEAFEIRNKLYAHDPAIAPEITYDAPNYTVRLGNFLDALEAYPTYAVIKRRIPKAIIRPIYFVNNSNIFIDKQTEDKDNSAPFVPAADVHHQSEQE